jgi:uncharacterized damage-inducible protein DinB
MDPSLSFEELLGYVEAETQRWHEWFKKSPAALGVRCDVAQAQDVRGVVLHIVAVDLRYAQRLNEQPITEYSELPTGLEAMFATASTAHNLLRRFLAEAKEEDWQRVIEFPTRSLGTLSASKRKIFIHTLLHGTRHWAQVAATLRAAGFKQDWQHDFLFSPVTE